MSVLSDITLLRLRDVFKLRHTYISDWPGNEIYFGLFKQISLLPYDGDLGTDLALLCATWWIEKGRFGSLSRLDRADKESCYFLKTSISDFSHYEKGLWLFSVVTRGNVVACMYWAYKDETMSNVVPFSNTSIKILCDGNDRRIID